METSNDQGGIVIIIIFLQTVPAKHLSNVFDLKVTSRSNFWRKISQDPCLSSRDIWSVRDGARTRGVSYPPSSQELL